jgi:MYXO-CTERM domain-containing protein
MRRSFVLAFTLAAGCVAGQAPIGEDTSSIIGGTTDTADPGVVLVFAQVPGAQSGSLCTGEVISPHVVLTAAHCVSPSEVGQGAQFLVYTGNDFNQQPAPGTTLSVKETHPNPAWNGNNLQGGHDVGVVILTNPTTITPLPFLKNNTMTQAMVGQTVRFVGYGLDNAAAQSGAGVKRTTSTMLSDFDTVLIHFADGTHETCNGDSGGPALMTLSGVETIVGTTSFGDVNCAAGGYDTRVDAETAFIGGYVSMFDPGTGSGPTPPAGGGTGPGSGSGTGGGTGTGSGSGGGDSSGAPGTGGSPTTGQPGAPSSSKAPLGQPCKHDADCQSGACGVGNTGGMVCVASEQASGGTLGGCSASGGTSRADGAALLLVLLGLGGLLARRRRAPVRR